MHLPICIIQNLSIKVLQFQQTTLAFTIYMPIFVLSSCIFISCFKLQSINASLELNFEFSFLNRSMFCTCIMYYSNQLTIVPKIICTLNSLKEWQQERARGGESGALREGDRAQTCNWTATGCVIACSIICACFVWVSLSLCVRLCVCVVSVCATKQCKYKL